MTIVKPGVCHQCRRDMTAVAWRVHPKDTEPKWWCVHCFVARSKA